MMSCYLAIFVALYSLVASFMCEEQLCLHLREFLDQAMNVRSKWNPIEERCWRGKGPDLMGSTRECTWRRHSLGADPACARRRASISKSEDWRGALPSDLPRSRGAWLWLEDSIESVCERSH